MKNILIFGASGHGSVVLDCLERSKDYRVVGFIDSFKKKGTKNNGYEVLGSEFDLPYLIEKYKIQGGIVAIGDNWTRQLLVKKILSIYPDFSFISAVHPSAIIGNNVEIGKGSVIMPGVIINANSIIGDHCILNTKSSLDHDSIMYNYASLAPGVCTGSNVILGEGVAVCLGVRIIELVTVGHYAVIGASSLVIRDIPQNVLAYGNPAQIIRQRSKGEPYLNWRRYSNPSQLRLDYLDAG
jgi:sugar O-acyltransferase (sialic acid O-acetyltransferase NeuD family)